MIYYNYYYLIPDDDGVALWFIHQQYFFFKLQNERVESVKNKICEELSMGRMHSNLPRLIFGKYLYRLIICID